MKGLIFAVLLGAAVGGYSKTNGTFVPCNKTYVDPFFIDIHDKKIHVEGEDGETIETSALFADDSGLYYKDFLCEEEEEVPVEIQVIDISPLMEENAITTDEQIELAPEEEPKETLKPPPASQKQKPAPQPKRPIKSWPYGKNR